MKIPDILYSGLSWSVVLLSLAVSPPWGLRSDRVATGFPISACAHTPTRCTLATFITYFCISYRCSRGRTFSQKRIRRRLKSLMRSRACKREKMNATTRRFDMWFERNRNWRKRALYYRYKKQKRRKKEKRVATNYHANCNYINLSTCSIERKW